MRRALVLVVLLFLLWVPGAYAWTWPVHGPVLLGFVFDSSHPYAGGQHRGVDIGASPDTAVLAPAAGTVTFAGTVPSSGQSVTIATADGYSVTLTHLGSIGVSKGASVGEGEGVGTVGPSGTPELDVPYLYMGVRVTAEAQGYLDPLSFLPALPPPVAPDPAPAPPPAPAASEPAPPPVVTTTEAPDPVPPPAAATTTTPSEPETGATDAPGDTTTPTPAPEVTATVPDPEPDATTPAPDVAADQAPAPDPPPADPPEAPAPAPAEDAGAPDSPAPPPAETADPVPPPTDSTAAPSDPPSAADPPAPQASPPPQQQAPPPIPPAPKKKNKPQATVINPDPGFDPTAPADDTDSAPVDDAATVPFMVSAEPLPEVASIDDAFLVRPAVPVRTAPIVPMVAVAPRVLPPSRPSASPPMRIVVPPPARRGPAASPHVAASARRRRPPVPVAPARHRKRATAVRAPHRRAPWWRFALALALAGAAVVKAVRMISSSSQTSEGAHAVAVTENPRRGRVAVRERTETPGPCRRPRRAVRHLRPLPPPPGQRRPHGERDGRARHAGDGVGGPGRRVAP